MLRPYCRSQESRLFRLEILHALLEIHGSPPMTPRKNGAGNGMASENDQLSLYDLLDDSDLPPGTAVSTASGEVLYPQPQEEFIEPDDVFLFDDSMDGDGF